MEIEVYDSELIENLRNRMMDCPDGEDLERLSTAYTNACKGQAALRDSNKQIDDAEKKFNRGIRVAEVVISGAMVAVTIYGIWTGRQSNLDGIYAEEKLQKFVNNKFYRPIKTKF